MDLPRPLFHLFPVFSKQTLQLLQQINVKNAHPVYCPRIRTQNLQTLSVLP